MRVFDITEFAMLRPQDLVRSACVVVSTIQAFRVTNTTGRKGYAHHEELEPHFSVVPTRGIEVVSPEEAAGNDMLTAGAVKFSFANLLSAQGSLRRFPLSQFYQFVPEGFGWGPPSKALSGCPVQAVANRLHIAI